MRYLILNYHTCVTATALTRSSPEAQKFYEKDSRISTDITRLGNSKRTNLLASNKQLSKIMHTVCSEKGVGLIVLGSQNHKIIHFDVVKNN